jgi:hypothetical protein
MLQMTGLIPAQVKLEIIDVDEVVNSAQRTKGIRIRLQINRKMSWNIP